MALNAVLPARGGDAAKVALVRMRVGGSSVPTIASTMSVFVLFDLVAATLLVLAVCLTGALPFSPQLPGSGAAVPVAVVAVAVAVCVLCGRRLRDPLRRLRAKVAQGGAILRTPGRYARGVALVQAAAWACRIGVVFCLLAAFGLHATVPRAALVMVLCGASTLVPLTPGGAGTQQVMLTYALSQVATAAAILSFSVGLQAGITDVNGMYLVPSLPPGTYTLRFAKEGLTPAELTALLPLGATASVDATLSVAQIAETVLVEGVTPPAVSTTQTSANITADEVNALPMGRTPYLIAEMMPGLTTNTPNRSRGRPRCGW